MIFSLNTQGGGHYSRAAFNSTGTVPRIIFRYKKCFFQVCGVKLEIAKPRAESPKKGFIVPNLTLSPICHPQFRPGPPSELAQTASHFLHESVINSGIINLDDLCILEDKYVWCIYADLNCLNYGGNILDTALKALVAALTNATMPNVSYFHHKFFYQIFFSNVGITVSSFFTKKS